MEKILVLVPVVIIVTFFLLEYVVTPLMDRFIDFLVDKELGFKYSGRKQKK